MFKWFMVARSEIDEQKGMTERGREEEGELRLGLLFAIKTNCGNLA